MIPTARSPRGLMKRPLVTKSVRCRTGCVRRRKTRSIPTEGRTAGTGFWLESILPWNIVVRMARCPRERDACDRILGNVSKAVCGVFGWIAFAGIGVFFDGFPSLYIMTFVCFYQFLFFLGYFFCHTHSCPWWLPGFSRVGGDFGFRHFSSSRVYILDFFYLLGMNKLLIFFPV